MNDITDKLTEQDMDGVTGRTMDDVAPDENSGEQALYTDDPDNFLETLIELDGDELAYRNKLLHSKKRGVLVAVMMLVLATIFPLWFLQMQEHVSLAFLLGVAGIITALIGLAVVCYVVFTRQIRRDLQSNQALLVSGYVVRGWQVNQRRDPVLQLNIGNHLVELPIQVMRRHVENVTTLDQLAPGSELMVEMTPHSRVIIRIVRL